MKNMKLSNLLCKILISFSLLFLFSLLGSDTVSTIQKIDLSGQKMKVLPCLWLNGKTIINSPPEPINRLRFLLKLQSSASVSEDMPKDFDPDYLNRILPEESLINSLLAYRPMDNLLPLNHSTLIDQFSEQEFLYAEVRNISENRQYRLYFRFNPYRKTSTFLFSVPANQDSSADYAGNLSETNQYCFVRDNQLFLFNPQNKRLTTENHFPDMTSFFRTDRQSLFLYVDKEKVLNVYSIRDHKVIWQNNLIFEGSSLQNDQNKYTIHLTSVSGSSDWVLLSVQDRDQIVLSLTDGKILGRFTFSDPKTLLIKPFFIINGSVWIQFYLQDDNPKQTTVFLEKIAFSKDKGCNATLFQLDIPQDFYPVYYSFVPIYSKLAILFQNESDEVKAVFGLP